MILNNLLLFYAFFCCMALKGQVLIGDYKCETLDYEYFIELNCDNKFTFKAKEGLADFVTKGKFRIEGDSIILKSHDGGYIANNDDNKSSSNKCKKINVFHDNSLLNSANINIYYDNDSLYFHTNESGKACVPDSVISYCDSIEVGFTGMKSVSFLCGEVKYGLDVHLADEGVTFNNDKYYVRGDTIHIIEKCPLVLSGN